MAVAVQVRLLPTWAVALFTDTLLIVIGVTAFVTVTAPPVRLAALPALSFTKTFTV